MSSILGNMLRRWSGLAAVLLVAWPGVGLAQQAKPAGEVVQVVFGDEMPVVRPAVAQTQTAQLPTAQPIVDPNVVPAGCTSCGSGLLRGSRTYGCSACGSGSPYDGCGPCGHCIPGREPCGCYDDTFIGRVWSGFYECICCPDPCYEPRWIAAANNAFFTDAARPVTQTRIRWDNGNGVIKPDRAEYFWARADGRGKGPRLPGAATDAGFLGETHLDYNELSLYTEAAMGNFSVYFVQPFRSVSPELNNYAAGFGDLRLGTKSMLLDCEMLQITLQIETTLPTASPGKGLGIGHTAINPSLLVALKLTQNMYWQMQVGEWLPIGGDPSFQGAVFHYSGALNYSIPVLCGVQFVMSAEAGGLVFNGGRYTDAFLGGEPDGDATRGFRANGDTIAWAGPSARLVICDKVDFGGGVAWALTNDHLAETLYRFELRWRF
ncbi:MAG TPA: transporter [Gemmatales bacterium]|nr:transporter [Gemmatales bacterium]